MGVNGLADTQKQYFIARLKIRLCLDAASSSFPVNISQQNLIVHQIRLRGGASFPLLCTALCKTVYIKNNLGMKEKAGSRSPDSMQLTRVTSIIILLITWVWPAENRLISALIEGRHILQLARRQREGSGVAFLESVKTPSISSRYSLWPPSAADSRPTGGGSGEGWGGGG